MSTSATPAPAEANTVAMARPIPRSEPAPVISATRPSRRNGCCRPGSWVDSDTGAHPQHSAHWLAEAGRTKGSRATLFRGTWRKTEASASCSTAAGRLADADQDPERRRARYPVSHLAHAGRLGCNEPGARLLGRLRGARDGPPAWVRGPRVHIHHRSG